jgi:uncharacterized membrane protein
MTIIKLLVALATLIAMDSLRLGVIAKKTYKVWLAPYMQDEFMRLWVGIGVRVVMIIGIIAFVWPKAGDGPRYMALVRGWLFGGILYTVYNGTNYAFFPKRPLHIVIIDTLRGIFACSIASLVRYLLAAI